MPLGAARGQARKVGGGQTERQPKKYQTQLSDVSYKNILSVLLKGSQ